jgi:MHS family alpha-ketoglutarate permease-like MFS transporter
MYFMYKYKPYNDVRLVFAPEYAMAFFGGNAEAAALYFKNIGAESAYFWAVAAVMTMSCVVALRMRDTRQHSRIED